MRFSRLKGTDMKIGKYPVKHSYKIPRIISDVFSVGLAVFICSVEIMFMTVYDDTLKTYIGEEALEKLMQADSTLGWKHWITLIFPAAVLAVFAVYIILVLKSHSLKSFNVTKRSAQKLYDMYALCASLCKIPALMFISEMMMITHNNMLMADEGWFTVQLVLDLLIILILICLFRHLMQKMTEPEEHAESGAVRVTAVVRDDSPEDSPKPENNDPNERS